MRLDISTVPFRVLKRSTRVYNEDGVVLRTDRPDSKRCWVVRKDGVRTFVNGDYALPCITDPSKDQGKVVATLVKIDPRTKDIIYGPAPVRAKQYAKWVRDGVLKGDTRW